MAAGDTEQLAELFSRALKLTDSLAEAHALLTPVSNTYDISSLNVECPDLAQYILHFVTKFIKPDYVGVASHWKL